MAISSADSNNNTEPETSTPYLYDAFISYRHNHRQNAIARGLQRALHGFAKPWYQLRAVRLYRDETNLSIEPQLWDAIRAALDNSRFFLLLASPEAARSHWVQKEITHWLNTKGAATLLVVLTQGEIVFDAVAQGFDPVRSTALPPAALSGIQQPPFWVDLSWVTDLERDLRLEHPPFRDVVASIAAKLRNLPKDVISGEDLRLRKRALRLAIGASAGLVLLATASLVGGAAAIRQAEEARREQIRAADWAERRLFTVSLLLMREVEGDRTFSTVKNDPFLGLDFGIYLGWNQYSGRLQQLLAAMRASDQKLFDSVFADGDPGLAQELLRIPAARARATNARFDFQTETWQRRFRRAGSLLTFQRVQIDLALNDFRKNSRLVEERMSRLNTERNVAFMLDVINHQGPKAALEFYRKADAASEQAIVNSVRDLSVKQARRRFPQLATAMKERRNLFLTTPFLVDKSVTGKDESRPTWAGDIINWAKRQFQ